jgi:hypothetical protein
MSKDGNKASLSSYEGNDEDETFEAVQVNQYEHPSHLQQATTQEITDAHRAKLREHFSIDEEYYQQWNTQRESEKIVSRKKPRAAEEDDEEDDTDDEKRAAAAPPRAAPAPVRAPQKEDSPEIEDRSVEQVPPVAPVFHSYDISVRQISQSALPPTPTAVAGCPATFAPTRVLAYGPANIAGQPFHNWPGFTIEAQVRLRSFGSRQSRCMVARWLPYPAPGNQCICRGVHTVADFHSTCAGCSAAGAHSICCCLLLTRLCHFLSF